MSHPFIDDTPQRYIWVDPQGDDGDSGTEAAPVRTIAEAIERAAPGTAIMVNAGTYNENVAINKSGIESAPIWLISADGPRAAKIVPASSSKDTIKMNGQENLVIQGFDVQEPDSGHYGIKVSQATSDFSDMPRNIVVIGNFVHGQGQDGIKVSQSDNVYVLDNVVDGATDQGIDFVAVNNSVISGNEVKNINGSAGIQIKGGSTNVTVSDNIVHHIDEDGIHIGGGTDEGSMRPGFTDFEANNVTVIGNTVHDVGGRGAWFMGAENSSFVGNTIYAIGSPDVVELLASPVHSPELETKNIRIEGNSFSKTDWLVVESGQGSGLIVTGNVTNGGAAPGGSGGGDPTPTPQLPTVSISSTEVDEGDGNGTSAHFAVTLSSPATTAVVVGFATSNGSAQSGSDFTAVSNGNLTIPAGATSATVTVPIFGDRVLEPDETFGVRLVSVSANARLGSQATATGTILNDDVPPPPTATLSGPSQVNEGNDGSRIVTFSVGLSAPANGMTVINYVTDSQSATAGSDYLVAGSGSVSIPAGISVAEIPVVVLGDTVVEGNESLSVRLTATSANAALGAQTVASLSLINDDESIVSIAGSAVGEGNSGSSELPFVVTLSSPAATDTKVGYAVTGGTAQAGIDHSGPSGGVITIPAGATSATIPIVVIGDGVVENDETIVVSLTSLDGEAGIRLGQSHSATGSIVNDDAAVVAITGGSVNEGNSGTTNAIFTVSLSAPSSTDTVVAFRTIDGSARSGVDYTGLNNGAVTIPAGQSSATVGIAVRGDTTIENNESFSVSLTGVQGHSGITLASSRTASATIVNDDPANPPSPPTGGGPTGGGSSGGGSGGVSPTNEVIGTDASDQLVGTEGADSFRGGLGNDTYIVNHPGDVVVEGAAGGSDGVISFLDWALPANVENLHLFGHAVFATGNGLDNFMTGSEFDNVLMGAGGRDLIDGGPGADAYVGGEGADVFYFAGGGGLDAIFDFNRAEGDKIFIDADIGGGEELSFETMPLFVDAAGTIAYLGESDGKANWVAVVGVNDLQPSDFIFA